MVVVSTDGCRSDTNTTMLTIRYRPAAALKYSALLCENEIIQFTDLSYMHPDASPEYIGKWYWQFDNTNTSSQQNPLKIFTAGVQHARLVVESNYGCKSVEADSELVIQPKPRIQLEINDSCVFRLIRYNAMDSLSLVSTWYWNMGNGLSKNGPLITRTYNNEGFRPLILIGQTKYGCKDTVIRPFTIYDNKAFAGADTIAAINEPVQLNSHGGANMQYTWSPATGLNNPTIENPVATLDKDQLYQLDAITDKGCDSHSKIFIKRYKGPELYIPTAFTPDGNGVGDVLKVFPVGIKAFGFFAVYNRYGQQVYRTTNYLTGWDGIFNGKLAEQGTYVAVSQAIDYRGNIMRKKTSVILLR